METGERKKATATFTEEQKIVLVAKRDRAGNLHTILEGCKPRGRGYYHSDESAPTASASAVSPDHEGCADQSCAYPRRNSDDIGTVTTCAEQFSSHLSRCCMLPLCEIAMPLVQVPRAHRAKITPAEESRSLFSCTACDVGKQGRPTNQQAKAALQMERDRARACGTEGSSGEETPGEGWRSGGSQKWRTVAHFVRVVDTCVENNFHLPEGGIGWMFKGQAAYQGKRVKGQDGNRAIFHELQ